MERISGREAITAYAEMNLNLRNFTETEKLYIYRQAQSFRDWLVEKQGKTLEEAKETCRELYGKDIQLLTEDDPYAAHIWSRPGDEVGAMEIDLAQAAGSDPEKSVNDELKEWREFETRMESIAEDNVGKYPNEVWKLSLDKYIDIMNHLHDLEARYSGKLLNTKDHLYLNAVWRKIIDLRGGKSPVLMWRHYAICRNTLDRIRGIKRKLLKVPIPKETEESDTDAHDAMQLVIHGLNVDMMYEK